MTDSEYHQVIAGERVPPSIERWDELRDWIPNLDAVVSVGVLLLLETINGKGEGWESVDDWVERMVVDESIRYPEHYAHKSRKRFRDRLVIRTLSLIMDEAKMDTMYWGVSDPSVESWCSYCKSAVPIEQFVQSTYTCDPCFNRRKENGKARAERG